MGTDDVFRNSKIFEVLRILRALRVFRTLRAIRFVRGLQVLVMALIDTIKKSIMNVVLLLLLIMFLFAIMGYYFFGYHVDGDKENWGNLLAALLTLFAYVTVDGWVDIQKVLDEKGYSGSRYFSVCFIFLGHFIFSNVFIGVIIMNINDATEKFEAEKRKERAALVKHKKEFMMKRQHEEIRKMMEKQKKGRYTNFNEMVREFQRTLRHDDCIIMTDLCTNPLWIDSFMKTQDHLDNTTWKLRNAFFEENNRIASLLDDRERQKYGVAHSKLQAMKKHRESMRDEQETPLPTPRASRSSMLNVLKSFGRGDKKKKSEIGVMERKDDSIRIGLWHDGGGTSSSRPSLYQFSNIGSLKLPSKKSTPSLSRSHSDTSPVALGSDQGKKEGNKKGSRESSGSKQSPSQPSDGSSPATAATPRRRRDSASY